MLVDEYMKRRLQSKLIRAIIKDRLRGNVGCRTSRHRVQRLLMGCFLRI
ncbi:MAG: hypothetical protein ACLRG4_05875 [[Ruminococcus] torques]